MAPLRVVNGFTPSAVAPPPRTLASLIDDFEQREAQENPDVIVRVSSLRLDPVDELLIVPTLGAFRFTDWSRHQLALLVGLKWDRWVENASSGDKADELNRRFARATGDVRVRTRCDDTSEHGGVVTALVSPSYSPVRDSEMARRLLVPLAALDDTPSLVRVDVTDRSTSYVVRVGEPYRVGGPGEVGDIWGCLLVRNSGVGFASLMVTMFLHRLACRNGMTVPLPDAVLIRRRHRALSGDKLDKILIERFKEMPGKLEHGAVLLAQSRSHRLTDVSIEARKLLEARHLPVKLLPAILAAYDREPHASAFGLTQAFTLAAQSETPEIRVELERAAGEYLAEIDEAGAA
ncbi:MAG: hypothetical protein ACHREM_05705 [Polyangiales bacterium]